MANIAGRSTDIVVVGGGAVGGSIAYEAARRGASVLLLESGPGPASGCSYANAGLLSPAHVEPLATPRNVAAGLRFMFSPSSPFYIRPDPRLTPWLVRFVLSATPARVHRLSAAMQQLALRGRQLHAEYAAAGLDTGFLQRGSLDVYHSERGWEGAAHHMSPGVQPLDANEARELEPSLGPLVGAVYQQNDAQVLSRRFVEAIVEAAQRHGAQVRWGVCVTSLSKVGEHVTGIETTDGTFRADHVVLAAGLGSVALARDVGLRLPMRGARGYVVDLDVAAGAPRIPVTFKERRVVATPYADRLRLSGTLELGRDNAPIDARRVQAIREAGRIGLPHMQARRTLETWAGLRPSTADGVPVLGRSLRIRNLVVATGHGMWGLVLAPVTGDLVARGIVEDEPVLTEPDFSPDRFVHTPSRKASSFEDDARRAGRRIG